MKILIITSCTSEKRHKPRNGLTQADFRMMGTRPFFHREQELAGFIEPAEELYSGQQHLRLMRGVTNFRNKFGPNNIDLWILSAGYGVIPGHQKIAPYECTFQGMKVKELRTWSDELNIPEDIKKVLSKSYDFGMILLGDSYLKACKINGDLILGGSTLFFCGANMAAKLPQIPKSKKIILSNNEAKRFSCGLVGLKGEVAARILSILTKTDIDIPNIFRPETDVLDLIEQVAVQDKLPDKASSKETFRFSVHAPRKNSKMHYFIPEWDDRVDPDYDFSCDGITPNRNPYEHDVYSHEIFKTPNYDGILVSKSVIEDNKKKKGRIEEIGIHAHIRVPRNFPVMGDCGAFNYINEENPPFETLETIQYYENLDFDFGVSIDHLILPQFLEKDVYLFMHPNGDEEILDKDSFEKRKREGTHVVKSRPGSRNIFQEQSTLYTWKEPELTEGKRRWKITLENSKDFIETHKKLGCKFTPIAGCQGWDTESQVEMFKLQQEMGYRYIALGGLVRSQTHQILNVLDKIDKIRKPETRIHLFGVARPDAIDYFLKFGVSSVDSARFLRQAWLSATSNYYSGDPKEFAKKMHTLWLECNNNLERVNLNPVRYTALRIPPIYREGSSSLLPKAKALIKKGYSLDKLQKQEKETLDIAHAFARGKVSLKETLTTVVNYDILMGGDERNADLYKKTLENKPWTQCPCAICKKTGIDTLIFRRNNRNRRRGFHNTWWFFEFFKQLTSA